ncbi:hypothetical protein ACHAQH_006279 [Verticillium albo-atrum]
MPPAHRTGGKPCWGLVRNLAIDLGHGMDHGGALFALEAYAHRNQVCHWERESDATTPRAAELFANQLDEDSAALVSSLPDDMAGDQGKWEQIIAYSKDTRVTRTEKGWSCNRPYWGSFAVRSKQPAEAALVATRNDSNPSSNSTAKTPAITASMSDIETEIASVLASLAFYKGSAEVEGPFSEYLGSAMKGLKSAGEYAVKKAKEDARKTMTAGLEPEPADEEEEIDLAGLSL